MRATRGVAVALLGAVAACASGSGAMSVRTPSTTVPAPRPVVVTNPWALPPDVTTTTTTPPSPTTTTTPARAQRAPESVEPEPPPEPPAPEPTVEAPAGGIEAIIAGAFPDHYRAALRVATCESNLRPWETNGPVRGLFQIHEVHAAAWARWLGRSYWSSWDDPVANATFAAVLSDGGSDWSAWSCRP